MKVYKITQGILIEDQESFYLLEDENWDQFINDDDLYDKIEGIVTTNDPIYYGEELIQNELQAPVESQEIWASGVTYYNSKLGREEESKDAGGGGQAHCAGYAPSCATPYLHPL